MKELWHEEENKKNSKARRAKKREGGRGEAVRENGKGNGEKRIKKRE